MVFVARSPLRFKDLPGVAGAPARPLALAAGLLPGLLAPVASPAAPAPYVLRDLEALERAGGHEELLRHARDVRPSNRDGAWRAMVVRAAREFAGAAAAAAEEGDPGDGALELLREAAGWPELAGDVVFHARRDTHLVRWLGRCLEGRVFGDCQDRALDAWRRGPGNPETGMRVAGALARRNPEARVLDFASKAALGGFGEFYCREPFLQRALHDRLRSRLRPRAPVRPAAPRPPAAALPAAPARPAASPMDPGAVAASVDGVMGKGCFETFSRTLLEVLRRGRPGERDFAHAVLSAKGALPRADGDLYLARLLLGPPRRGRTFNLAWAVMGEVALDHRRRAALVEGLGRLDPLPDHAFAGGGSLRARTIANRLRDTLPEYLDRYVRTCLDYLAGKGDWPKGNPTVHCDGFFRATGGSRFPTDEIRLRHAGLRRFEAR